MTPAKVGQCVRLVTATEFCDMLHGWARNALDLAQLYVQNVDARPEFKRDILETNRIPKNFLDLLERLGRGQLLVRLFLAATQGERRLRYMPLSVQTEAIQNGIPVLDDDEQTQRNIPPRDMTGDQVTLVFARDRIRSIAEQRTIIRAKKAKEASKYKVISNGCPYKVTKHALVITGPCEIQRAQLLVIQMEMEALQRAGRA